MQFYIGLVMFIGLKMLSNIGYRNIGKMSYQCNTNNKYITMVQVYVTSALSFYYFKGIPVFTTFKFLLVHQLFCNHGWLLHQKEEQYKSFHTIIFASRIVLQLLIIISYVQPITQRKGKKWHQKHFFNDSTVQLLQKIWMVCHIIRD